MYTHLLGHSIFFMLSSKYSCVEKKIHAKYPCLCRRACPVTRGKKNTYKSIVTKKNLFLPATILSPPLTIPPPHPPHPPSTYVHCSCVSAFTRRHVRVWGVGAGVPGAAARRYCPYKYVCICVYAYMCECGCARCRYIYVCIYLYMYTCVYM
jgi:hypothetical protein